MWIAITVVMGRAFKEKGNDLYQICASIYNSVFNIDTNAHYKNNGYFYFLANSSKIIRSYMECISYKDITGYIWFFDFIESNILWSVSSDFKINILSIFRKTLCYLVIDWLYTYRYRYRLHMIDWTVYNDLSQT